MGEHGRVEDIEPPVLYVGNTVVRRETSREGGRDGNERLIHSFSFHNPHPPQADGKREWRALPPCSEVRERTQK
jgi:hypothetical protein